MEDFLTSGFTAEEHNQFRLLPEGSEIFEYLGKIPEPLRLRDFHNHTLALGLPECNPPVQRCPWTR